MINNIIGRPICQKVLPLTYDDSLSYYEQLCKLTNAMNNIIDEINNNFSTYVEKGVDKFFNQIMMEAVYNEETETITLQKQIVGTGDTHIYTIENKTMSIE